MKIPRRMVLWDIDRTLLTTGGAGQRAFFEAGREIVGETFTLDGVDTLGRLDSVIWRDVALVNGLRDTGSLEKRFRVAYRNNLKRQISMKSTIRLLPGVRRLIGCLEEIKSITQGILSGNYPEIGQLKLQGAGLRCDTFKVWVGGSDGNSRQDLVQVALTRYARLATAAIEPGHVIIIGDTPRDVDCAKAHGCRCVAVATGRFSKEALEKAGADFVREDLTNTEKVLNWICH